MSNTAPPEWWKDEGARKPGPARIRVTLNRSLTPAEHEHLVQVYDLIRLNVGDKVRVAPDDRIYAESTAVSSRSLYAAVAAVVERSFVNVFPVAVRTFRELVEPTVTVTSNGLMNTIQPTFSAYSKVSPLTELRKGLQQIRERYGFPDAG